MPEMSPLRRWRAAAALAAVVTMGAAGVGATALLDTRSGAAPHDVPSLAGRVASTTTADPGPSITTIPLPTPQDPPTDANARVATAQIGTLAIPKLGVSTPVFEGVWLTVIDLAPGHWPGTAVPGGYGNAVFAGHRITHTHPFRHIDELVPGDDIVVRTATGTFDYKVTGSEVVTPDRVDIVDQRPGYAITLFACHPPGSAAYRYVVRGTLASSAPPGG